MHPDTNTNNSPPVVPMSIILNALSVPYIETKFQDLNIIPNSRYLNPQNSLVRPMATFPSNKPPLHLPASFLELRKPIANDLSWPSTPYRKPSPTVLKDTNFPPLKQPKKKNILVYPVHVKNCRQTR